MEKNKKLGLGLAAGAALGSAGAYYLYGPKGKENRKKAAKWLRDAHESVEREVKKLSATVTDKKNYEHIAQAVRRRYEALRKVDSEKARQFARSFGTEWRRVSSAVIREGKRGTRAVGRAISRLAKEK